MSKNLTYFLLLIFAFIGIVSSDSNDPLSVKLKATCNGTELNYGISNFSNIKCNGETSSALYFGCQFEITFSSLSDCKIDYAIITLDGTVKDDKITIQSISPTDGDTVGLYDGTGGTVSTVTNYTIANGTILNSTTAGNPLLATVLFEITDTYDYTNFSTVYVGNTAVQQLETLQLGATDFNGLAFNTKAVLYFKDETKSNSILSLSDSNFTIVDSSTTYNTDATYEFVFKLGDVVISSSFSIKFHFCVKNCNSCNETGCLECKTDYYLVGDENIECSNLDEYTNYYIYGKRIKNCHSNCKTCLIGGSDTENHCTECKDGLYFAMEETNGNCYSTLEKHFKYAIDSNNNYIFKQCSNNCTTCESADICNECETNFTLINLKSNSNTVCVDSTKKFYIDEDYKLNVLSGTTCPVDYPYEVDILSMQCLKNCPDGYAYIFQGENKTCYNTSEDTKPDGYVYISDKDYLQKCSDSNCKSCNTNLECTTCMTGYALVSTLTLDSNHHDCYDTTLLADSVSWYLNESEKFQICTDQETCAGLKCYQIDTYTALSRCYLSLPGYYIDTTNKVYKQCPTNCSSCDSNADCLTCKSGYIFLSEITHLASDKRCVSPCPAGQPKFNYDDTTTPSTYTCLSACNETYPYENIGTDICSTSACLTGYAYISDDSATVKKCYKISEGLPYYYYYYDSTATPPGVFKQCSTDNNCLSCYNSTYCNKCAEKNSTGTLLYLLKTESEAKCLTIADLDATYITGNISGYYIDDDKTVNFCLDKCLTCTNSLKCIQCLDGYAFKEDDTTVCYYTNGGNNTIEGYQINKEKTKYIKCNTGCLTCELNSDGTPNGRCDTCDEANDYYHIENDANNLCYGPKYYEKNEGYYLDTNSTGYKIIKKCNEHCSECDSSEPCKTCYTGYALKTEPNECWGISEQKDGYLYDSDTNKFLPCHSQCTNCFKSLSSDSSNHYCTVCKNSGFYLLSDDSKLDVSERTGNCYNVSLLNTSGYFLVDSLLEKCDDSCLTCSDKLSCDSCDSSKNYYPMENTTNDGQLCYSSKTFMAGFYFDSTSSTFKKCISYCKNCTDGTNCNECYNGYALLNDNTTECHSITEKIENYTYISSNNIFKKCDSTCYNCTASDDPSIPMCVSCSADHSFLIDDVEKRVCHDNTTGTFSKGYYYYETNNTYLKCIDNCETCNSTLPLKCTKCASGYAYIITSDNSTNQAKCYSTSSPPEGYYFDVSNSTTFQQCSDNCAVCENSAVCSVCKQDYYLSSVVTGVETDVTCLQGCEGKYWYRDTTSNNITCTSNCSTTTGYKFLINNSSQCIDKCEDDFAYKDGNTTTCFTKTLTIDGYVLTHNGSASIFKACDSNCLVCTYESDDSKPCSKCKTNYFFNRTDQSDTNTTCELETNLKDKGYYKNSTLDPLSYYKCPANCLKCTSSNTCNKCNTGYAKYQNDENTITCQPTNTSIIGYGIDTNANEFVECNTGCLNCSDSNNVLLSQKTCVECNNDNEYYQKNYGSDKTCYKKDSSAWPPDAEKSCFLNTETKYIEECIDNCEVCETNSTCETCKTDFYMKQDLSGNKDKNECYDKTRTIENYTADDDVEAFVPCDEKCKNCKKHTDGNSYCTKCATNYAFKDDDLLSASGESYFGNCYSITAVKTDGGYYYDSSTNIFQKCNNSTVCKECANDLIKCKTCFPGYYKKEDVGDSCFSGDQDYYYLDTTNSIYKKCPNNCKTCINSTKCSECDTNSALKEDAASVSDYTCYSKDVEVKNYVYYDDGTNQIFKKCMDNCIKCENPNNMTTSIQNCLVCNNTGGYYLKEDDTNKNCYLKTDYIENGYYLDTSDKIMKSCLGNCSKCNDNSTCLECFDNEAMKVDNDTVCYEKSSDTTTNTDLIGYYYSSSTNKFEKCNSNCLTCKYADKTNYHNCESCDFSISGMDESSFDQGYNCYPFKHFTGKYLFNNSDSTNPKVFYKDCEFDNCDYCTDPTNDATVVTETPTECTKCKDGYFNDTSTNQCKELEDGYYADSENTIKKCASNCKTCKNDTVCTICNDGYKMINEYVTYTTERYCVPECNYRWYITNPTTSTDGNTLGFTCSGTNETCPTGYEYHMNGTSECKSECDTNSAIKEDDTGNNANNCYNLNDPHPGYYFSLLQNKLLKCPDNCDECKNSTVCTTCSTNYTLLSTYSKNDSDKLCVPECSKTYYFKEISTNAIDNFVCTSNTYCSANTDNYIYALDNETSKCLLQCPDGFAIKQEEQTTDSTKGLCHNITTATTLYYYYNSNNKTILKCHDNCLNCLNGGNDTYNNCTKCKTGTYFKDEDKYKGNCYDSSAIGTGYFLNTSNNIYYKCIENCKTCSNTKNCTVCNDDYAYIENDQTKCYNVSEEMLFYQYLTNSETGITNGVFKKCPDNCIECTDKATKCSACVPGYKLKSYYTQDTSDNTCVEECTKAHWYIDSNRKFYCVDTCPTAYPNIDGKQCFNDCPANKYLKKDEKLNTTLTSKNCYLKTEQIEGYYFSTSELVFIQCPDNCERCNDGVSCDLCSTGFQLLNVYTQNYSQTDCVIKCDTQWYKKDTTLNVTTNPLYIGCASEQCSSETDFKVYVTKKTECLESCPDGYAIKNDSTSNTNECFNIAETNQSDYYYNTTVQQLMKCASNCKVCSDGSTCDECEPGYSLLSKYYSDESDTTINIKQCVPTCDTKIYSWHFDTDNDNQFICNYQKNCTPEFPLVYMESPRCIKECSGDNYKKDTDKCYPKTQTFDGYYANEATETFEKCGTNCKSCDSTQCSECLDGYEKFNTYYSDAGEKDCVKFCDTGLKKFYYNNDDHEPKLDDFDCTVKCGNSTTGFFFIESERQCLKECPTGYAYILASGEDSTNITTEHECFVTSTALPGYYLTEENGVNIFKQCDTNCKECVDATNCTKCNDYYDLLKLYTKDESHTYCVPTCNSNKYNWYFNDDETDKFDKFTCLNESIISEVGNTRHLCQEYDKDTFENTTYHFYLTNTYQCLKTWSPDTFAPREDSKGECFLITKNITGYYFDGDAKMFKKCDTNCAECVSSTTCTKCSVGYSLASYYTSNSSDSYCVTRNNKMKWIYNETNENKFEWIEKCSGEYPFYLNNSKQCKKECDSGYKPFEEKNGDNSTERLCYEIKSSGYDGYFEDTDEYKLCPNNCEKCTNKETCSKCKGEYIELKEYTQNASDTNCVVKCNLLSSSWYLDDDKNVVCVGENQCPPQYLSYNQLTKQCIKSASKEYSMDKLAELLTLNGNLDSNNIILSQNENDNGLEVKVNMSMAQFMMGDSETKLKEFVSLTYLKNNEKYLHLNLNDADVIYYENNLTETIPSIFPEINFTSSEELIKNAHDMLSSDKLIINIVLPKADSDAFINEPKVIHIMNEDGEFLNAATGDYFQVKYDYNENSTVIDIKLEQQMLKEIGQSSFDPSADVFNDHCNNYNPISDRDMTVQDRRDFLLQKNPYCQNCYIDFDFDEKKMICNCSLTTKNSYIERKSTKTINHIKTDNYTKSNNFHIINCSKDAFKAKELKKNAGFYISLVGMAGTTVLTGVFLVFTKGAILAKLAPLALLSPPKKSTNSNPEGSSSNDLKENTSTKKTDHKNLKFAKRVKNVELKKLVKDLENLRMFQTDEYTINDPNMKKYQIEEKYMVLNYREYSDGVVLDKRFYSNYLSDLILEKHFIISTFVRNIDLFPMLLRIIMLIFFIMSFFFWTFFFITEKEIQNRYRYDGSVDLGYMFKHEFKKCVYVILIMLLYFKLNHLFRPLQRQFRNILSWTINKYEKDDIRKIKRKFIIRIIIFFIIVIVSTVLYFIYLTSFCFVYKNTVVPWIAQSIFIIVIATLVHLALCVVLGSVRFIGLYTKNRTLFNIGVFLNYLY